MTEAELLEMLRSRRTHESTWVERKPEGVNTRDIRREACAFANTLPDGKEATIFFGLDDRTGNPTGITNADALQKRIDEALRLDCYPPIDYFTFVLSFESNVIVAVVIPASRNRPHFSGPAFVRNGSRTGIASNAQFEELILSRIDVTRELLRYKNEHTQFSIRGINYRLGSRRPMVRGLMQQIPDCKVESCTGHVVTFYRLDSQSTFSESIKRISIEYDDARRRPLILVTAPDF